MKGIFDKTRYYLIAIGTIISLVFLVCVFIMCKSDKTTYNNPLDFSYGWKKKVDSANMELTLSRMITPGIEGRAITFYVYDAYVYITVGGEEIYHYGNPSPLGKSPSSIRHLVNIPPNSSGKTLLISFKSVYPSKFVTDVDFQIGSMAEIIVDQVKRELFDIVLGLMLLLMGLALIVIFFGERINGVHEKGVLFLGCICLLFFLGSSTDLYLSQLIVDNNIFLYFLYYYALYAVPLFLLGYLEAVHPNYKNTALIHSHMTLITVLTVLHFTKVAELTETLHIYFIILGIEILIMVVKAVRRRNPWRRLLRIAFAVMVVFTLINIAQYLVDTSRGVSLIMTKIGICIYMMAAIITYIRQLIVHIGEAKQGERLRILAETDTLTGLKNRLAFSEEMERADIAKLSLVSFDLNNLKYYNDQEGHYYGDKLICKAAEVLDGVYTQIYRTGGDEFIAVEYGAGSAKLEALRSKLMEATRKASDDKMVIEIACGGAEYREGDTSYEDILKRADEQMYLHKQELKAKSSIASVR